MSNKIKDISIKSHTYYFFNDIINVKIFDQNNIKINEKSCKNILIYYPGERALQIFAIFARSHWLKITS